MRGSIFSMNSATGRACRGPTTPGWRRRCGRSTSRDGTDYVLEDKLRTPSGISYVLENRDVLKRSFPRLFENYQPLPVDDSSAPAARRAAPIEANPRDFIAPPIIPLSTHPTIAGETLAPRHIDLRPFVLMNEEVDVPPTAAKIPGSWTTRTCYRELPNRSTG
jgi:uncharacterized circularly permuted ATP-grasp superfamily protein